MRTISGALPRLTDVDQRGTTSSSDPLIGRTLDGRYAIEAKIARGGMATVYRATDRRLDRAVAIKVMHPSFAEDPGFAGRFVREARSAARLAHPHVVAVHDQGESDGVVYLVMEYLRGRTLRDVLREHGALSPAQALVLIEPILEALSAAHNAGIIHRDVKPENVIITDEGRIKVADFGLARVMGGDDAPTMTQGVLIGTVNYLSPEQVERGAADARSDIYAAGILLFELLTGRPPFSGETPLSVAYQHVNNDVPAPSSVVSVPPIVDSLVSTATRREPSQRYRTAAEFAADVRRARAALPAPTPLTSRSTIDNDTQVITTNATSVMSRSAKPAISPNMPTDRQRQRRGLRTLATLLLMLGLATGAYGGYQWWSSTRSVAVPDVTSLSIAAATSSLTAAGLAVDGQTQAFSESVAAGRVIATTPTAGAQVRTNSPVVLVVSQGPERYEIPQLQGLTRAEVQERLRGINLALGTVAEEFSDYTEAGRVLSSSPVAGTSVKRDTVVGIVISKGPEPIAVPTLVGTERAEAVKRLQNLGLKPQINEQFSSNVAKGRVISQEPASGNARRGSTISLIVSKGPELFALPNVVGLKEADAKQRLEAAGFKVRIVYPLKDKPFKRVATMSPKAGTLIALGTTITLQVV